MTPDAGLVPTTPSPESTDFFTSVYQAIQTQNWRYLVLLIIVALVFVSRKIAPEKLKKGKWAWALAVFYGVTGAVITMLAGDMPVTVGSILGAIASGAFVGLGATGIVKGAKEWAQDK